LWGEYYQIVEQFVQGVRRVFPSAVIQWEDFGKHNAYPLLQRYRHRVCSFNDDIQGTGAVATAALLSAMKFKGESLRDQMIVIFGQGQAGIGIANQVLTGLQKEGLGEEEAKNLIFGVDKDGLLLEGMSVSEEQEPWLKSGELVAGWKVRDRSKISLLETVLNSKATVLIGVTGQTGAFSEEVLTALAQNTEIPVILPLSNPTAKSECTAEFAMRATGGKALCATGSPFPPVKVEGKERVISQCNNLFVFPGVGLGALVSGTPIITDQMFMAASKAVSGMVTENELRAGQVLPKLSDIRAVSAQVALAVAKVAREAGLGLRVEDGRLSAMIKSAMWNPRYLPLRYVKPEFNY
jgi:malate dehydrogenase (oxaloacetate-decarboxylating)